MCLAHCCLLLTVAIFILLCLQVSVLQFWLSATCLFAYHGDFSLCISCIHLGCLGSGLILFCPLELKQTSQKCSTSHMHYTSYQMPGTLSAFVLHHSIHSFLYSTLSCFLGWCLSAVYVCLYFCTWSKPYAFHITYHLFLHPLILYSLGPH